MGKPSEKKAVMKRLDALVKRLEDELKGADLFVSRNLKARTEAKSQTRHIINTLNADKLQ